MLWIRSMLYLLKWEFTSPALQHSWLKRCTNKIVDTLSHSWLLLISSSQNGHSGSPAGQCTAMIVTLPPAWQSVVMMVTSQHRPGKVQSWLSLCHTGLAKCRLKGHSATPAWQNTVLIVIPPHRPGKVQSWWLLRHTGLAKCSLDSHSSTSAWQSTLLMVLCHTGHLVKCSCVGHCHTGLAECSPDGHSPTMALQSAVFYFQKNDFRAK